MTKIYIVRHCEAIGNIKHIFQGTTDLDITELGAKQLEHLEERFKDTPLDRIYSSPLIRTQKTAKAIIGNKKLELEINQGIIEINGGFLEGKPFSETFAIMPELSDTWLNHPQDFAPKDGEPMKISYERIWNEVKKIAVENQSKTVALATHGGVMRCLHCRLLYNTIDQLAKTPWTGNTAVSLLEFDDSFNPKLVFYNDVSHLPENLQNIKSKIDTFLKENK